MIKFVTLTGGILFLVVVCAAQHLKIKNLNQTLSSVPLHDSAEDSSLSLDDQQQYLAQIAYLENKLHAKKQGDAACIASHVPQTDKLLDEIAYESDLVLLLNTKVKAELDYRYGAFIEQVSTYLDKEAIERLKALLSNNLASHLISGKRELSSNNDRELSFLLGKDGYTLYQAFEQFGDESSDAVRELSQSLEAQGEVALDKNQVTQLTLILVDLKSNSLASAYNSLELDIAEEAYKNGKDYEEFLRSENSQYIKHKLMIKSFKEQAESVLTYEQIEKLRL